MVLRLLVTILVVFAPAAAALPLHQCTELGCALAVDLDGDGVPDDARGGFAVDELVTLNFYHDENETWVASDLSSEETVDPWHDVSIEVLVNRTSREGGLWLFLIEGDEETGESRTIASRAVLVRDADGNGRPDLKGLLP